MSYEKFRNIIGKSRRHITVIKQRQPSHWLVSSFLIVYPYLRTPDTDQDTCRVPAYPWHCQGICRVPAYPWHRSGYPHTSDTGQGTCRVPAYPWHWSGYPQGTRIPLTLVRVPAGYTRIPLTLVRAPAGYLHTPDTGQGTCRVPAYPWHWSRYLQGIPPYPWHWSGHLQGTRIPLTLVRVPAGYTPIPLTLVRMWERTRAL